MQCGNVGPLPFCCSTTSRRGTTSRGAISQGATIIAALIVLLGVTFSGAPDSFAAEQSPTQITAPTAGSEQYVQVANAKLRETPKHWGKGILELTYGSPVTIIDVEQGWLKVRSASGAQGYIHQSALSARKIAFAAGSTGVQIRPDDSDVVLAGKGFSSEIESSYRDSHKELNFDAVDQMELLAPTDKELSLFVTEGKLRE